jgi:5,6-dimethylbenzimidazole synthase
MPARLRRTNKKTAAAKKPAPKFDAAFRRRLRELLVWRRDVRRFLRDALPNGKIEELIALACLAPSVGLSEPWRFVIVEDDARRAAIRRNFELCNAQALAAQSRQRAARYARKTRLAMSPCSPTARRRRVTCSAAAPCRR